MVARGTVVVKEIEREREKERNRANGSISTGEIASKGPSNRVNVDGSSFFSCAPMY